MGSLDNQIMERLIAFRGYMIGYLALMWELRHRCMMRNSWLEAVYTYNR